VSLQSHKLWLPFVIFAAILTTFAQQGEFNSTQLDEPGMSAFIAGQMRKFGIPGAGVAITQKDRIVYAHGFGIADSAGNPITSDSLFLIGSNSKSFTALAVMQLVEAGKVSLDDPVTRYLPWFHLRNENPFQRATVRHLLNHTSGLPRLDRFVTPMTANHDLAVQAFADELKNVKQSAMPGTVFQYSDVGYQILALLIESATQDSFAHYVTQHILDPLEMHSTFLTYDAANAYGLVEGHQYLFGLVRRMPTPPYSPYLASVGNMASTAENMAHFVIAQSNGGFYKGRSLISPASLSLMHAARPPIGSDYGMGWFIESWNGLKSFNDVGMNKNFSSLVSLLPQEKYGIVLLLNVNSVSIMGQSNLVDAIIRRLRGEQNISYWPQELIQRLLVLSWLCASLVLTTWSVLRWRRRAFRLRLRINRRVLATIAAGSFTIWVLLVGVPTLGESAIFELIDLQPDIGYGLVATAILIGFSTLVNIFCLSDPIIST